MIQADATWAAPRPASHSIHCCQLSENTISNTSSVSSLLASPHFLRRVLWLDAATGTATGLLQLLLADALAAWLGLPAQLVIGSGWLILAYVAGITWIATRAIIPRAPVWALIAGNLLWVLACLSLLLGPLVTPTLLGKTFIAVQAVTVGLLLELQWLGMRHAPVRLAW